MVHDVASVDPETGGPARTVPALCTALEDLGVVAGLVTRAPLRPDSVRIRLPRHVSFVRRGVFGEGRRFEAALVALAEELGARLLHDHGMWLRNNHASARAARALGRPRVVSPRGMADAWSLAQSPRRKRLAWLAYQRRDLERADLLHATSGGEADGLRALGLRPPIAVVPNGVDLPDGAAVGRPRTESPRVALFLSRIHPKKGLPALVEAWARVRPTGWELWVAGPDEDGHRGEVEETVHARGLARDVRFLGPVDDDARARAFERASLFVLPTHSENFGLVVAEALAAGLPVVTTRAAPWEGVSASGSGWWVETGAGAIEAALSDATRRSPEDLARMGRLGRAFVESRYGWGHVAERMRDAYAWLLGGGPAPDHVQLVGARA